jgi:hypothetical protein
LKDIQGHSNNIVLSTVSLIIRFPVAQAQAGQRKAEVRMCFPRSSARLPSQFRALLGWGYICNRSSVAFFPFFRWFHSLQYERLLNPLARRCRWRHNRNGGNLVSAAAFGYFGPNALRCSPLIFLSTRAAVETKNEKKVGRRIMPDNPATY